MHILSCDQMVSSKNNNQTTRSANSTFYMTLYQFCPKLHLKRLNSLMLTCHALLDSKTLTELGRNLPPQARTKNNIKRIYRSNASFLCAGNSMPIVLIDWSDIREHKRLMILRTSRSLCYSLRESISPFKTMLKICT